MNIPEFMDKLTAGVLPEELDKYSVSVQVNGSVYGTSGINVDVENKRVVVDAS